ncbi:DPP IV N-terminal domain-containing protein, partial [Microbacteriaceae bacterium K1510]|nr:DPP IV N-terminal domain-containing protein [Microbacteriaceae bacterium K1510]
VAPLAAEASPNQTDQLRVAFIRDGNLWIKAGEKEVQLTKTGGISGPKWSNDGNWIAYRKASSFADHSIPVSRQRNIRHLLPASSEELW